jgi:hypothetical protein
MPISIVQDAAVLPPSQPVPAEALPPLDPPEQAAPRIQPTDAGDAARRHANASSTARKPAEAVPGPQAPPVVTSPPLVAAPGGSLVPSDPNIPGREALAAKINELRSSAARIAKTSMTNSQRITYKRVESFIKLSEGALSRGDLRQAGELADRAATLARALTQ